MSTLKQQTVTGVKWLVGSSFLQKAIQLAATVVLARILGPAEFGLFALAFVAIDALGLFKSMGFDSALIQRQDDVEKAANTAFFIIPILGIILYTILAVSAPWIGKFLNNQNVVGVIRALGIIFVISCFGKVPAALLEKHMKFKQVSIIEIGAAVVYSVSAVTFAVLKFGVWSLVIAYILKTLYQNVLTFYYARWTPKFEFDSQIAQEMFHFGKFLFLASMVWFLKMNLDNIMVGRLLGVTALGFYAVAFNSANFCADYFGGKIYRVAFPAYSKLQDDLYDLRSATLKMLKYISIVAVPFGVGLFLLSEEFLRLVYGEKWLGAVSVLRILIWAGIFNTLPASLGGVFLACRKPKLGFWIAVLQVATFTIFIGPMAKLFGINGVGFVVSMSGLIAFVVMLIWVMNLLSINLTQIYLTLKPALVSSLFMGVGILFFKYIVLQYTMGRFLYFNFIVLFISASAIYVFSLFSIEGPLFKEMKEMIF